MLVWLHSKSPPQHIAHVTEAEVSTSDKLRAYMQHVNERRAINAKWAGIFEGERAELRLCIFWDVEQARAFIARNDAPIISTED